MQSGRLSSGIPAIAPTSTPRHRGNPRWASSAWLESAAAPVEPSGWDRLLGRLDLGAGTRGDQEALEEVRRGGPVGREIVRWARENRNRFLPEELLEELGLVGEVEARYW
jgi:hypothetical protein